MENIKKLELHDQLLMLLLKNSLTEEEKEDVNALIKDINMNWEMFLGKAFFNRVNGTIYCNMKPYKGIPREVKLNLELMYNAQVERVKGHKKSINRISELFIENDIRHAFLKGSVLNTIIYPNGNRISNDTDILVSNKDIKKVTEILENEGFIQGHYDKASDTIEAASKKEKLFIRVNTHELCSFVRLDENRFFRVNSIDINFKLSAKDSLETTELLLDNVQILEANGVKLSILKWDYFFIQLASHLYREARLVTKIMSGADMHMYKFYDFYVLLNNDMVKINWKNVVKIAEEQGQSEGVYYALYCIEQLFPGTVEKSIFDMFSFENIDFVDRYVGKQNSNESYMWSKPFFERFFDYKRRLETSDNIAKISDDFKNYLRNVNK